MHDDLIPAWIGSDLCAIDKLEVHQRGLRHKAVSVFVMDGAKVLLQQRAMGKYHTPGLWANTCCTHPHIAEDPADCARRRLEQELGVTVGALHYRKQVEYRADVGGGLIEHELVDIFVADASRKNLRISPDPAEVMATRWVEIDALKAEIAAEPQRFTPWLRIYLTQHRDLIFGATLTTG
ncbi:isopentenyl-diphosphate Delta-isomerase [Roseicitreum antarcticum]|nr:isopentenyl-diphosphate Delta-isomerase [Roseicitreum antarcticum]